MMMDKDPQDEKDWNFFSATSWFRENKKDEIFTVARNLEE